MRLAGGSSGCLTSHLCVAIELLPARVNPSLVSGLLCEGLTEPGVGAAWKLEVAVGGKSPSYERRNRK